MIQVNERILAGEEVTGGIDKDSVRRVVYWCVFACAIIVIAGIMSFIYMIMYKQDAKVSKRNKKYDDLCSSSKSEDKEREIESRYQANLQLFSAINGKPMDTSDIMW